MKNECPWCGGDHQPARCSKLKSIEYDGSQIKRVEFFSPAELQYSSPHDVAEEPLPNATQRAIMRVGLAV